jgi:hypothetical protein
MTKATHIEAQTVANLIERVLGVEDIATMQPKAYALFKEADAVAANWVEHQDDTDFMSDLKKGFSKAVRRLTDSKGRKTAEAIAECQAWLELAEDDQDVMAPEEPVADDEDEEIDPDAEYDDQDDEVETEEVAAE